ncbi:MAG TPA: lipopolysaccharide biosynthesis protein [Miltoncostaea sp.]|nr:lipopolysaccharide biosynthesis protein [Miltoncostaea sp.]
MARRASYREALSFGLLTFVSLAVFGVATSIVLARIYGVEVIGQFALASAPLGLMIFISSAQEQAALSRKLATLEPKDPAITPLTYAVVGFSALLTLTVGVVVAGSTYVLFTGPVNQPELVAPAMALLVSYLLVQNTCWNADIVLLAFRAGRQLFWIRLEQAVVFFTTAMIGAFVFGDVWALVVAWVASWLFTLVTRLFALRLFMHFRCSYADLRAGMRELPGMIRFGLKATLGQVFGGINSQVGTITLGIVGNVLFVGAWSRAQQLVIRVQDASLRLQEVLYPTLVERRDGGDAQGHDRALVDSIRLLLIGLLALAAAAGGAAHGVMALFGDGFTIASDAFAILLLAQALSAIPACCSLCLWAANRPLVASAASGVGCLCNVIACVAFSMRIGVTGPAVGALVGQVVAGTLMTLAVKRELTVPLKQLMPWKALVPLGLAYGTAFAASRVLDLGLPPVIGPAAGVAIGLGVFGLVIVVTGGLNEREKARVAQLVAKVGAKFGRIDDPSDRLSGEHA